MIRTSKCLVVLAALSASFLVGCGGDDGATTATETDTGADTGTGGTDTSVTTDTGSTDDTGSTTEDTGTAGDGSGGDAAAADCTGKADGTDCGGGNICRAGVCAPSSCGDGFIDTSKGEECEDGNTVSGDGCSACKYDCKADTDCDDTNTCTTDTCDKTTAGKQLCKTVAVAGTPACTPAGGGAGTCKAGVCAKAGCGNSTVEAGEDCDDGNADNADGCTTSCKFTCKADADCDDGNKCNGTETCNTTTHKCAAGTAVTCTAASCATAGTCNPTTGACTYSDLDKDGTTCEKDCNDADPTVFPGAYECKDGKDNDCSAATADSTAPDCLCYADGDKDGYAIAGATTISSAGACPAGYTRRKPVAADATTLDCKESNVNVFPGNSGWYTSRYCKSAFISACIATPSLYSYDYNCNGTEDKRYTVTSSSSCPGAASLFACVFRSGWIGTNPACGVPGSYRSCTWNSTTSSCTGSEVSRTQECH